MFVLNKLRRFSHHIVWIGLVVILAAIFWPRVRSSFEGFDGEGGTDPAFVMFYAPWCGYCKKAMPDWDQLEQTYKKKGIKIMKIDCDQNKDAASRFGVRGFPTIKFLPRGLGFPDSAREYQGERTMNHFVEFLDNMVQGDPDDTPDQAAPLGNDEPAYSAGLGPLTTSYVARHTGLA